MAKHLSMNTVIHAAVRRDLARFDRAFATFPVGSRERALELQTAWRHFNGQLHHHHDGEETIFWPALRTLGADEALVSDLGGEHERMIGGLDRADVAIDALVADPSEPKLAELRTVFADLSEAVTSHFAHEEADLEPMLPSVLGTPEWKQAEQAIRRTQTPPELGVYLSWLLDGAGPDERDYLRHLVPPPVLAVLTKLLGRSYARTVAPVWAA